MKNIKFFVLFLLLANNHIGYGSNIQERLYHAFESARFWSRKITMNQSIISCREMRTSGKKIWDHNKKGLMKLPSVRMYLKFKSTAIPSKQSEDNSLTGSLKIVHGDLNSIISDDDTLENLTQKAIKAEEDGDMVTALMLKAVIRHDQKAKYSIQTLADNSLLEAGVSSEVPEYNAHCIIKSNLIFGFDLFRRYIECACTIPIKLHQLNKKRQEQWEQIRTAWANDTSRE